jgi:nucleoid-associated protein YgaU
LVLSAVVALLGLVWQVAEATAGAFGDATAAGPARPEDVVGGLAGGAMFVLLAWLLVAVVVSTAAALLPAGRQQAAAVGRVVAPAVLRHLVAALVGAAVVGAAAPASADVGGVRVVSTSCATPRETARPPVSRETEPAGLNAAWNPTAVVSPGWLPTERVVRPPVRPGADPSVVTSSRRRTTVTIDDEVVVRRGDTLWSLAERHLGPAATAVRVNQEWPRWFAANRSVLSHGPDHLVAGMRLTPPPLLAATGTEPAGAAAPERLR